MRNQFVNLLEALNDLVKTKKGTIIKRYKNNVGKLVSGQIYVHKNYAREVIPSDILEDALEVLKGRFPKFSFNCLMYDSKKESVRFDEAPDFDEAREPIVGNMINVSNVGDIKILKSNMIWHHKWLWVKDDYKGFDVKESRQWSKLWASKLEGIAKGNKEGFDVQLKQVGLV